MATLLELVLQMFVYVQPINFFLVMTTNILNIYILYCRTLRASPCTYYFLAYAFLSIIYTCILSPTQFLLGLNINWINGRFGCKTQYYLLYVIPFLANLMLILASFDRYCSSSLSRRLNSASTIRRAKLHILVGSLFGVIYILPMLIIYDWNSGVNKCLVIPSFLNNMYIVSQVSLYYIISPLLITLFGFWTISNIRQQSIRLGPLVAPARGRRTERQLVRMLLLQIGVHLIFVLPFGVVYTMNSFHPSSQTPNVLAIRLIFAIWQQCDYFISFFLYILSGGIYRQQLIQLFKFVKCVRQRRIQPIK